MNIYNFFFCDEIPWNIHLSLNISNIFPTFSFIYLYISVCIHLSIYPMLGVYIQLCVSLYLSIWKLNIYTWIKYSGFEEKLCNSIYALPILPYSHSEAVLLETSGVCEGGGKVWRGEEWKGVVWKERGGKDMGIYGGALLREGSCRNKRCIQFHYVSKKGNFFRVISHFMCEPFWKSVKNV